MPASQHQQWPFLPARHQLQINEGKEVQHHQVFKIIFESSQ
jgi:hypothetical protein